MGKILVAVATHCDDVELNAGGTVAKWAAQGGKVHIVMVTNNCAGEFIPEGGDESAKRRILAQEATAIRRREQEAAAALIGASVRYLDYSQRHYWDGRQQVTAGFEHEAPPPPGVAGRPQLITSYQKPEHYQGVGKLLVLLKPDVVLTHGVLDVDPEHHAVCSLMWLAFRECRADLKGVALRFWTPGSSCMWGVMEPNYDYFEDISDYFDRKLALCRCHASQMIKMRLEMVEMRARHYGAQMGVRYAEPFNTAKNWDR